MTRSWSAFALGKRRATYANLPFASSVAMSFARSTPSTLESAPATVSRCAALTWSGETKAE